MNSFTIISAMDLNRGIGKDGVMPWHLSEDLKHFARTTKGGTVIMGRKTWESIPERYRPFSERFNIVISRQEDYEVPEGVLLVHSLEEALEAAQDKTFVIGGGNLYAQAIQLEECEELILTMINETYDVDTYFPEIPGHFKQVEATPFQEENGLEFAFIRFLA